jgi:hypothetical protein
VVETKLEENPYIVALSFDAVGRTAEALALMRDLEGKLPTRKREFMIVAQTLLEGHAADSIGAARRIASSDFPDPEGLFYMARHLARLDDIGTAIDLFRRVVDSGFSCWPQMSADPWLDRVRARPSFAKILHRAETQHRRAASAFKRVHGDAILGSTMA